MKIFKRISPARWVGGAGALSAVLSASAWANTEVFVEIRERAELQENLNDKFYGVNPKQGESSDAYLLGRVRVGLNHQFNDAFKAKISLQDSRAMDWGFKDSNWVSSEFDGIEDNPQHDPLELSETWLQYSGQNISVKAGRQAIAYGDNRVFGPGAWKNSGKWVWDAAVARYQQEQHWLDAFYGKTMLHDPNEFSLAHRHGYTANGLYGHIQATDAWVIEPMLVTKYNNDSADYQEKDFLYYGARSVLKANGFKVDATYVQQTGNVLNNRNKTIDSDAKGYNLDIEYRFNPKWMVGATHAFASGDDKTTANTNERFDGVYGASDKYYGRMNTMVWSNLNDYGVYGHFRPNRDLHLELEYHQFYADKINDTWRAYKDGLKANSTHYGDELDVTAVYKVNKSWEWMAGVGVFLPGLAIQQAVEKNQANITNDTAYSGFMQVMYKFNQVL